MRIAYLADPTSVNGIYRAVLPMGALAKYRGYDVQRLFTDDARPIDVPLTGIDVVYVHRYCDARAQQLVRRAHDAGAAVLWDNDDDFGSMPRSIVTYRHFGGFAWERRLSQMRRVFASTDLATTPSRVLSERLASWGAPTTDTIENYLEDFSVRIRRRPRNGTTIGWIAGGEHTVDVQQLPIVEVLQRILDERPDVRVVTVGLRLQLRSDRYEYVQQVGFQEVPQQAAEFDLGIAPLSDIAFNQARSNIKLKEYAAGGTPWLASPIGPYAQLGERQGGRLVRDDEWYEAITQLLDRPRESRRLAKRAARWAAAETISKNVDRWTARCAAAIELRRGGASLQRTA